jgi:hypothetical protein
MNPDLYKCKNCGASLSLEQLRGTDCPYCKTAFPHQARANEQAVLVNQIMAQQIAASAAAPWMVGQMSQTPHVYGAPPPAVHPMPMSAYGAHIVNQQVGRAIGVGMILMIVGGLAVGLLVAGGVVAWVFLR